MGCVSSVQLNRIVNNNDNYAKYMVPVVLLKTTIPTYIIGNNGTINLLIMFEYMHYPSFLVFNKVFYQSFLFLIKFFINKDIFNSFNSLCFQYILYTHYIIIFI